MLSLWFIHIQTQPKYGFIGGICYRSVPYSEISATEIAKATREPITILRDDEMLEPLYRSDSSDNFMANYKRRGVLAIRQGETCRIAGMSSRISGLWPIRNSRLFVFPMPID